MNTSHKLEVKVFKKLAPFNPFGSLSTWLFLVLWLPGCYGGPIVNFFSLSEISSEKDTNWKRVSDDPYVLKRRSTAGDYEVFLTSIEECGKTRKDLTASIGRQLFVGFDELRLRLQQVYPVKSSRVLRSIATASLDNKPVILVSYTSLENECSRDIVLWFPGQENLSEVVQKDIESFEESLSTLLNIS